MLVIKGWSATILPAKKRRNEKNAVATGESEIYTTKKQAWASIKKRASGLDYGNNEVRFNNGIVVKSFVEVEKLVSML
jgi:hypothetical protein